MNLYSKLVTAWVILMPHIGCWHCGNVEPSRRMCGTNAHAITYVHLQLYFKQSTSSLHSNLSLNRLLISLKWFHMNSLKKWVMRSSHYGWVISLVCLEQATLLKLLKLSEVLSVNSVWAFEMENYIILGEGIDGQKFLSMDKDQLESLSLSTDTQQTLMNIINDMVNNG